MKNRKAYAGVLLATASLFVLTACGSSSMSAESAPDYNVAGAPAPSYANDGSMPQDSAATSAEGGAKGSVGGTTSTVVQPVQRQIIRTGNMSVTVTDVKGSAAKAKALTTQFGGYVSAEDSNKGEKPDQAYWSITSQIPSDKLDEYIAAVTKLGEVTNSTIQAQDVTSQVVDLDARIKALQTSIDRLNELIAKSGNVADLTTVEGIITQRQADLDSLIAQRKALGDQVAMSSITTYFSAVPDTRPVVVETEGFSNGWEKGWVELQNNISQMVTDFGYAAPFLLAFLIPLALFILVIVLVVRWAQKRQKAKAEARLQALPAPDGDPVKDAE